MTTKEWILTGTLSAFVAISAYLAVHIIDSTDASITDLSGKFDKLNTELGTDKTNVAVLNTTGQQLRDDIHQTRSVVEENGRKLDTITKDLAYVQGQMAGVQEQLKSVAPSPSPQ